MSTFNLSPMQSFAIDLDSPFTLTTRQVEFYEENGYIKLQQVLGHDLLAHYEEAIHSRVAELSRDALPLDQRDTYGKAFLQVMNLWEQSPKVREFVFGRRLARIAAELMRVRGVRIYHDQALYKEPGGGITPWHADQYYWPVDSDKTITAWIPLQDVSQDMGPLAFSEKSHRFRVGRDLEISDKSETTLKEALSSLRTEDGPFGLGDVSFHAGWTFHRAGPNTAFRAREIMTIIYMDKDIRMTEPRNKNQVADLKRWAPGLKAGDVLSSPLNPVIYSRSAVD